MRRSRIMLRLSLLSSLALPLMAPSFLNAEESPKIETGKEVVETIPQDSEDMPGALGADPTEAPQDQKPSKTGSSKQSMDAVSKAATGGTPDSEVKTDQSPRQVEVTADQSLEWYQEQHMYVARGNAKAVRGDMVVEADLLSAHAREAPAATQGPSGSKPVKAPKPPKSDNASNGDNSSGDIDRMIADGHVRITDPRERVMGDHAVDDMDRHVSVVTGNNLRYETEKETVTAKDSLEYWEDKHVAVARGHAVAVGGDRHVEGDTLTAEFRLSPTGEQELWKMTAIGHVTVITKADVSRGDKAVYDISRDIAILTGNVLITRADGTQLTGDVGEVDFKTNQSRLMNEGHGRVRALLASKTTGKATAPKDVVPSLGGKDGPL